MSLPLGFIHVDGLALKKESPCIPAFSPAFLKLTEVPDIATGARDVFCVCGVFLTPASVPSIFEVTSGLVFTSRITFCAKYSTRAICVSFSKIFSSASSFALSAP
ncbi:hypothetical protein AX774_g2351 [Zancudomyces culisetae]|uniref:Uncharacterized protein n=1 Tax=Zancudomyces culisetae TaxID=1213189 RepID=A0A1R1PT59_ZANCU|nr:hypothetical protein AX774_g2351 [Zancudomyces culisetae]|eukprot:OMH84124.1 hypothetical protein AX774_g2351 [Zancudomyces culisetae]